jgi:hypothetical protein
MPKPVSMYLRTLLILLETQVQILFIELKKVGVGRSARDFKIVTVPMCTGKLCFPAH